MGWRIRRVSQAVLTVFVVITLTFCLTYLAPGSPVDALIRQMTDRGMTGANIQREVENLLRITPTEPVHIAFFNYFADVVQGKLGQSIFLREPVVELLARRAPWTIFLLSWATFISFGVGIVLGAFMAYYEGGKLDVGLSVYAMIAGSVPYYIWAIFFLVIFAMILNIFPASGRSSLDVDPGFTLEYMADIMHHATLPILSLILSGSIASLSMRGNSIRVLGEDYMYVARVRGLSDLRLGVQYVLRNAILPMYTGFMISVGAMFGGAVILETVFSYSGMGLLMLQSLNRRDYPALMGVFMVITISIVITLLIADLSYGKLDPRAGGEGREAF
jgi:peptide/nickel transport system permease protein